MASGRPKMDQNDRKNGAIIVRVNDEEKEKFRKMADKMNVPMAEMVRELVDFHYQNLNITK